MSWRRFDSHKKSFTVEIVRVRKGIDNSYICKVKQTEWM